MFPFRQAVSSDKEAILRIDAMVTGDTSRAPQLSQAIDSGHCYTIAFDNDVTGYAVIDQSFFRQTFLSLLVIHPFYRRMGLGDALLQRLEEMCPTEKLFLSTSLTNTPMQKLCKKRGYVESGSIDNLNPNEPELVFCKQIKMPQSAPAPRPRHPYLTMSPHMYSY
ncbi:GNAT family N-acetyltransferase [Brevibacillus sp. TJ4]|uniref:GNAT family N-acetyltransferase n=1 Tax=Brevibacillus sp. TJ4 TaxID=3234853 RepID=UPI0037CE0085